MADNTEEVLRAMKQLDLSRENGTVAIDNLHKIRQGHGETVRSYSARLRIQTNTCKLLVPCACGLFPSASEFTQKHILISGLADSAIHRDILSHSNDDLPLDETIAFIESKESGARGEMDLPTTNAISGHQRGKRGYPPQVAKPGNQREQVSRWHNPGKQAPRHQNWQDHLNPDQPPHDQPPDHTPIQHPQNSHNTCTHCGGTHPIAWGKQCNSCSKFHHFASKCRGR